MARNEVTLTNIAGFVEKVIDATTNEARTIEYSKVFGPIFEEYMRQNQWLSLVDFTYGDEERVVHKINYQALRDSEADFDPNSKATGATIVPEEETIKMTETKEVSARWYQRDFDKSNGLQSVGNRITGSLFKIPDGKFDRVVEAELSAAASASALQFDSLDIDTLAADLTPENGQTMFVALKNALLAFVKDAANNDYSEGTKYDKSQIKIAISVEVEELLTAYKSAFIDQSGLLNVGVFGSQFRNVTMSTMTEMGVATGAHVLIFTKRAFQGTFQPAIHTKVIPESVNQTAYMNEVNVVYGYGTKLVFDREVAGIFQTTAPAGAASKKAQTQAEEEKAAADEVKNLK